MTRALEKTNRDLLEDLADVMRPVLGNLEALLAQTREHAQERATWNIERAELKAENERLRAVGRLLLAQVRREIEQGEYQMRMLGRLMVERTKRIEGQKVNL